MTPTEKQKCIAEQSVYGDLKALYLGEVIDIAWAQEKSIYVRNLDHTDSYYTHPANIELILRPLSDLTKTITHKGCNDDKPFVPLVEFAKMINPKLNWYLKTDKIGVCAYACENNLHHYLQPDQLDCCSIDLFDLLLQWHFDTRSLIEKCEAVDVNTLTANPYEV